jgi:hypothetical protein
MRREYDPYNRENSPIYLLKQANMFLRSYKEDKSTNAVFYACLDCRIALEINDLTKILTSVSEKEREEIITKSRPRHGINKADQGIGVLKERYQLFFQAVSEVFNLGHKAYDFKRSKALQNELSKFVHSYWMQLEDLKFGSTWYNYAIKLVDQTKHFIMNSLDIKEDSANDLGIEVRSIPEESRNLLNEWKENFKMSYDELITRLQAIQNRSKS